VARVNFILLASLKITAGPILKDLDPDSIRKKRFGIAEELKIHVVCNTGT
jgi:hypothetical protein